MLPMTFSQTVLPETLKLAVWRLVSTLLLLAK